MYELVKSVAAGEYVNPSFVLNVSIFKLKNNHRMRLLRI